MKVPIAHLIYPLQYLKISLSPLLSLLYLFDISSIFFTFFKAHRQQRKNSHSFFTMNLIHAKIFLFSSYYKSERELKGIKKIADIIFTFILNLNYLILSNIFRRSFLALSAEMTPIAPLSDLIKSTISSSSNSLSRTLSPESAFLIQ